MGAGYFIPVEGQDLVVHWSTFWDEPTCWGTLQEIRDSHPDLTDTQVERLLRTGATWYDETPRTSTGLIVQFKDEDLVKLGGYLHYDRIPDMLALLDEKSREQPLDPSDIYARMKALFVVTEQDPTGDENSEWFESH